MVLLLKKATIVHNKYNEVIFILEKIQDFIIKKTGNHDLAYYVTCCIYLITTYTPIIVFGILFDILPFVIVSAIVFNKIRKFCGGFHCTSNLRCSVISNMLIIIAGYMSKYSLQWLWLVFLIALISIKDLYIKAPFKEQINDIQPKIKELRKYDKYCKDIFKKSESIQNNLNNFDKDIQKEKDNSINNTR